MSDEHRTDEHEEEAQDEPIRLDAVAPRPTANAAFRIPQTREWVKFSDDYSFMEVKVWVDAPSKVMEGLLGQQPDEDADSARERVQKTLGIIVLEHRFTDGTPWTDDDGVLPPPQDPEFWERAPQPIVNAIFTYIRERIQNHPTLRRSRQTPKR
jgi:hypothetical protein